MSKKWFASIWILLLLTVFISSILLFRQLFNEWKKEAYKDYYNKVAYENWVLWIKDWINKYLSDKIQFYDYNNKSPCIKNYSVRNTKSQTNNSSDINELLSIKSNILPSDNILIEKEGFINRKCSVYSKWLPNKIDSDFSFKLNINSENSNYKWWNDDNGFYNIWIIYNNENKWYFFTKNQIWVDKLNIILDYNFQKLNWNNYLNIFSPNKFIQDKLDLLKKEDENLVFTKTNLNTILWPYLEIWNWDLEIWIIEFDWAFDNNGFNITQESWKVLNSDFENGLSKWANIKTRLLCSRDNLNCSLNNISLIDNKVYFFYLKSFDKTTTYHVDFQDSMWNSVDMPTDKLYLSIFWYWNYQLYKNETYYDLSKLWWYFSSFDSSVYNYVYFNLN